jgi:arylsulfatase A-like enzyme/Tfp pilus assembly protein PilF
MRWAQLSLFFWLLGTVQAADQGQPRPNILLVTLDTTRADRMGFLGSKDGLTPRLDELAKQSVIFTRAYSHVPLTTASHSTILTGTYPQFNHVVDFGIPLSPNLSYLPDILHHHGYHTGAFVGSLILDALNGTAPGFDRGFDVYDAGFRIRPRGADRYKTVERRGGEVVEHAIIALKKRPSGPFFAWVHLYDAHDPYDPPEPYKTKYAGHLYDGEIAYADACLAKLLDWLRTQGLFDKTVIAVMADHGESLGAHGENTHGVFLYDETIHVPLLIKLPGNRGAGKRIDTRVGLVDVAPTILDLVRLVIPSEMQGKSLLPLLTPPVRTDADQAERMAYAETDYPRRAFGWSALRAARKGKYLYIQAPEAELYDQETDQQSKHNMSATSKAVAETLAAQLNEFRSKTSQTLVELAKPDPEQVQKLQALGYVASDTSTSADSSSSTGPDPKSKIEVSNLLHDAMLDVEDGRYEQAVPLLQQTLQEQPNMAIALMQLGIAQTGLKNYTSALEPLRKAVELLPDSGMGHYDLGLALYETGDWKAAAPQFEAAVARAPRWADAHFSLASVYARIDRVPDALTELDTALSINPNHYHANLLRGRILSLQGKPLDALPNLKKAVEVSPDSREAHAFLADAYAQLGRTLDADREQSEAERLRDASH